MLGRIHLGRVFGIDLGFDPSWLLILLLMGWNLTALFGSWHPDWSGGMVVLVAGVASLLFFASVVVHELAHSLVARAYKIPVRSITLFLFGGVSNIEKEPESPGVELLMAAVGPLASVVIGVAFLLAAAALTGLGAQSAAQAPEVALAGLSPAATLFVWLGPINIVVGLFNLIPAFPLDGGRIFRALLWLILRDVRTATAWATGVGQLLGWVLVATGVSMAFGRRVPFFGTGLTAGLWLSFIGWFLASAARQSRASASLREMVAGIPVSRFMRSPAPAVEPGCSVGALVDNWFMRTDERSIPVARQDTLVGMVGIGDLDKAPQERWEDTPVSAIMTPLSDIVVAAPQEDMTEAIMKLGQTKLDELPVLRDGHLVGVLRQNDVARWLELRTPRPAVMHPRHRFH